LGSRLLAALPLLLAPCAGAAPGWAQDAPGPAGRSAPRPELGLGPFDLTSQAVLHAFHLSVLPRSASTLRAGEWELAVSETVGNVLTIDGDDHDLDFEMLHTRIGLTYGLADDLHLGLELQDRRRSGGSLDQFIREFHEYFDLNPNKRDNVDKGRNHFELQALDEHPAVDLGDEEVMSQDVVLSLRKDLPKPSRRVLLTAGAVARVGLSGENPLENGEPFDLGLSLALSTRLFGPLHAYAQVGHAWFGQSELEDLELRETSWSGLGALEWRVRPSFSLLAQYLGTEAAAESRDKFRRKSHELAFGAKLRAGRRWTLELALLENVFENETAPDFGLHFGLQARF
jgi:hypothetical protein